MLTVLSDVQCNFYCYMLHPLQLTSVLHMYINVPSPKNIYMPYLEYTQNNLLIMGLKCWGLYISLMYTTLHRQVFQSHIKGSLSQPTEKIWEQNKQPNNMEPTWYICEILDSTCKLSTRGHYGFFCEDYFNRRHQSFSLKKKLIYDLPHPQNAWAFFCSSECWSAKGYCLPQY